MNNSKFYKIGAGIGIALIALVIVFISLAKNRDKQIAKEQSESPSVMSSTNIVENENLVVDTKQEEFNEIETKQEETKNNDKKKNSTNKTVNTNSKTTNEKDNKVKEQTKTEEVVKKDPVFTYPVKGEVILDYAKDKLVYSNTLGEWITHCGMDIKAEKTTVVTASAEGTVKSIKNDQRYGLTVVIEHNNGFSTVYSNLLTAEFVSVGENVKSGQTIGTVGNTASFEILDEPHLHFEILKNNEQIDPNMYLKN